MERIWFNTAWQYNMEAEQWKDEHWENIALNCFFAQIFINAYMEQIEEEEYNENGEREVLHSVNLNEDAQWELKERVDKILGKLSTIDEELEKVTKGWKLNRIGKVELTILRLACYEIKYDREVPTAVAINEAVELAKKYGGEESASFVNGILAKLVEWWKIYIRYSK